MVVRYFLGMALQQEATNQTNKTTNQPVNQHTSCSCKTIPGIKETSQPINKQTKATTQTREHHHRQQIIN